MTFAIHKYIMNYVMQKKGDDKNCLEQADQLIIPKKNLLLLGLTKKHKIYLMLIVNKKKLKKEKRQDEG